MASIVEEVAFWGLFGGLPRPLFGTTDVSGATESAVSMISRM